MLNSITPKNVIKCIAFYSNDFEKVKPQLGGKAQYFDQTCYKNTGKL